MRVLGGLLVAVVLAPAVAMAQGAGLNGTAPRNSAGATGQQNNQPSANQNQSQMQTNDSQQPGQVRVLPPSADAQSQPNPLPELSK